MYTISVYYNLLLEFSQGNKQAPPARGDSSIAAPAVVRNQFFSNAGARPTQAVQRGSIYTQGALLAIILFYNYWAINRSTISGIHPLDMPLEELQRSKGAADPFLKGPNQSPHPEFVFPLLDRLATTAYGARCCVHLGVLRCVLLCIGGRCC